MKKILIFGSSGMLGHVVFNYLNSLNKYKLFCSANHKKISKETYLLDVRDRAKVNDYLDMIQPDFVINCAGLLIDESENNIEDAILINSLFPNQLSRIGQKLNFKLIQISTDCVFSGKEGSYSENSLPDGISNYARTKILGEINNNRDLTIRMSIIGPELKPNGKGLLSWFLNQKGEIFGYDKTYWSGVTTLEFAKAIEMFIDQELTGIYNFTSEKKISKYNLLLLIQKIWGKKDVIIKVDSSFVSDKSLCNTRYDFQYQLKNYEEMLVEIYQWMLKNKVQYNHYFN